MALYSANPLSLSLRTVALRKSISRLSITLRAIALRLS